MKLVYPSIDKQIDFNKKYGIIPQTIKKPIENNLLQLVASYRNLEDIIAEEMIDRNMFENLKSEFSYLYN